MPRGRNSSLPSTEENAVRYDKWLWAARLFKTRSLAAEAIDAGHLRVNGQRCKPGRTVHVGDRVELVRTSEVRELEVMGISALRGPAPIARTLYTETEESQHRRTEAAQLSKLAPAPTAGAPRPTKRQRRELTLWVYRNE